MSWLVQFIFTLLSFNKKALPFTRTCLVTRTCFLYLYFYRFYGRNKTCMAYILYTNPWICIPDNFMPYYAHHTGTVVIVAIAIVVVEIEWTCIGIIIVASTFEERVRRIGKVRVRLQFYPYYNCYSTRAKSLAWNF